MTLPGLFPAGPPTNVSEDVEAAIGTQPPAFVDTPFVPEGDVKIDGDKVTAPSPAAGAIEFTIPSARSDGYRFRDEGDGAFRALFHIPSAQDPTRFVIDVDGAYSLTPLEDGGITVRVATTGDLAGVIAPPWAVDAAGRPVATKYSISRNTIVQQVSPTSQTVFPVVADPFWIPALMVVAHLTRHVATQAAARGVSQALMRQVVQNGTRSAGHKGTSVFTQGKGASRIRVVVDNKSGHIITVTKG